MGCKDDLSIRLKHAHEHLGSAPHLVIDEVVICAESILREVITQCYQGLSDRNDVSKLKTLENKIGKDDQSYHNFGLRHLFDMWKGANVPRLWGKLHGRIPGVFVAMPFEEIAELRNQVVHHAKRPPSDTQVRRLYYTTLEFFNEVFDETGTLQSHPGGKSSSSRKPIPNNLPRVDYGFVGRRNEVSRLLELLRPDARYFLVSITGVGGVGKTAVALEAARKCLEASNSNESGNRAAPPFDGIVWTSAKQHELLGNQVCEAFDFRSNLRAIVSTILRVLDPDTAKNLPDHEKQQDLARSLLGNSRILLIVDNMETVEDDKVMSFLNNLPAPSKAIITDRRSVQASMAIQLRTMSPDEAAVLVNEQARECNVHLTAEQIDSIVTKTGAIPLAVVWTIRQMAVCGTEPDTVLRRLTDTANSPVLEFLFGESYRSISENSRQILSALSLVDSLVHGNMLADWQGLDKEEAEDAITELLRFALVTQVTGEGRERSDGSRPPLLERSFRALPLVRDFAARERDFTDSERRERIAVRLLESLTAQESNPNWPSIATIDAVDENSELYCWAAHDAFTREAWDLVVGLASFLTYPLGVRGHNDTRVDIAQLGKRAAEHCGDDRSVASFLIRDIGWVQFMWYRFPEAEEAFNQGLALARQSGYNELEGLALRNLGLVNKEKGCLDEAEGLLNKAVEKFKQCDNKYYLAIAWGSLGSLARERGMLNDGEEYMKQALDLAGALPNSVELKTVFLQKMARLMVAMDRLEDAEAYNREAMSELTILKRQLGRAHCKYNLALIAEKRGNLDEALAYAEEAAELFLHYGAKEDIAEDLARIRGVARVEDQ